MMTITARKARMWAVAAAVSLAVTFSAHAAGDKTYVMKISLATVGEAQHQFAKDYAAAIAKDSGGRIKTEIYPASQLGSIQQQAEGVQFGAIQCQVVPPEFLAGIDERFELLTAPALVTSIEAGQRLAANPAVRSLMLGLGADKGLHGVALFMVGPSVIVSRKPIAHLADLKGKKIRIFASQFQRVAMQRLGAVPKAMTLGEVLPALQDNALDGAISAMTVLNAMQFARAAKYVTEIDQPGIFGVAELSRKWYEALPPDLQHILDKDAGAAAAGLNPWVVDFNAKARKAWTDGGGQLISLPPDEQAAMLRTLASVGADVSKTKPSLAAAYKIIIDAAK
jgi:TRAP-type C4-dicarboxylate transport system substrate-binding protein